MLCDVLVLQVLHALKGSVLLIILFGRWQGCNDYASALTLPYLFKAWEAVGVEKARQYASQQLWNGIDLLLDAWDITNSNRICSKDLHSGNMALVELPKHLQLGEAWADPIQVSVE